MEAEQAERIDSPLLRLAAEESITLRGIISPDYPTVDREMLERLIVASQSALSRQLDLLRPTLDEYQQSLGRVQDSALQAAATHARTLKRLEPMLDHAARLVHELQVLQRLRTLLSNA